MVPRNEEQPPQLSRPLQPRLLSVQSFVSKRSFRSHSSSFEADDERSTTTDPGTEQLSPRDSMEQGLPPSGGGRYPGEDTRPTSRKELAGWYMYAFAAETYVICGKSCRLPLRAIWAMFAD
jgi:MFS transporter, UMF1 family